MFRVHRVNQDHADIKDRQDCQVKTVHVDIVVQKVKLDNKVKLEHGVKWVNLDRLVQLDHRVYQVQKDHREKTVNVDHLDFRAFG